MQSDAPNPLTHLPIWSQLMDHAATMKTVSMRALFRDDPERFDTFSSSAAGLLVDYSKNLISSKTRELLINLAHARGLASAREAMLKGAHINKTEDRAVLHVALRATIFDTYTDAGQDVLGDVFSVREKMRTFCTKIHDGLMCGFNGQNLDTVVNIGIGGSDLGPVMVTEALKPYHIEGRRSFFVSNVDGTHLAETLKQLDPARTLFVIASKTFTTQETMTNANSVRKWFLENGGTKETIKSHFIALSTNEEAVRDFGIDTDNMFAFWDWVGGRYSLWSAIGLSIALQLGFDNFEALLAGARDMDQHFKLAPFEDNLPVLLALIGVWHRNFLGYAAHAVLPYDQYLHRLPAYLQQADMESNGKMVGMDGSKVSTATGPIIFGEAGTNGQHAFYQLIHQGTDVIPTDFIAPVLSHNPMGDHHTKLLANFLAQPEALMKGKPQEEVISELQAQGVPDDKIKALAPHKVFSGNRPSTSIMMKQLTPQSLGALIALYEHKIFCQGIIWGVNSFDQWGVELGKVLASKILPKLASDPAIATPRITGHDSSTTGLIRQIHEWRKEEQI